MSRAPRLYTTRIPTKQEEMHMEKMRRYTQFRIGPKSLGKWMHQNKAKYTDCYEEGSLLDNFVVVCKNGYAAVYEHYLNDWSSDYRVEFQRGDAQDVFARWYDFEETVEKERAEFDN
jgi:hypothetical protein